MLKYFMNNGYINAIAIGMGFMYLLIHPTPDIVGFWVYLFYVANLVVLVAIISSKSKSQEQTKNEC